MGKSLVLAENHRWRAISPACRSARNRVKGTWKGKDYIVTWALGHLVTLADPEAYDVKYKNWNLADLPMLPQDLKLTVIKQSGKQFNAVKAQLVRNDVSDIIIATDAGREGELVARWIIEKGKSINPSNACGSRP